MPRISKKPIHEEILTRIYRLFFELFLRSQSNDKFLSLIDDVLTPTEKVMIAKRIGIIYLLIKGVDQRTISDKLKVSGSTVAYYSILFHKRNTNVVKNIKDMLLKEKVLGFIEDIFADLFIQPGIKIGHHKLKADHEKSKEDRKVLGS